MSSAKVWILALLLVLSAVAASADDKSKSSKANSNANSDDTVDHGGGKKDLDAIGNRNVGCGRGVGNWYSMDSQIKLGKSIADQVTRTARMVQDPVVTEYINRIGQNLVRNSDAQVPFTIRVIDSDEINAFALPGGYFFVNSGVLLAADNESEMAGVMAHEIAHVAACHAARGATRGNLANLASIPLIFVGGGVGIAAYNVAGIGVPMTFMKFSRNFEAEADYLGVEYLYKSGYDPQSFVHFFEKIQAQEKRKPGFIDKAFASHPMTPDRIEAAQKEIGQILPAKNQYLLDTSEFQDVKTRLLKLQNRRRLQDRKDNRPSLRREDSPGSNRSEDQKDKKDDDHPTLHRRDG